VFSCVDPEKPYLGDLPEPPVRTSAQELLEIECGDISIATIGLNLANDPSTFLIRQEAPDLPIGVGEVDQKPVAAEADDNSEQALEDEDPAPARKAAGAIEVDKAKGEDAGEGRGERADDVEEGVALAHLEARVPSTQQVNDAGEEAGLKKTQHESQRRQTAPVVHQAQTDQHDTPRYRDEGQEWPGADLSA
jgi:hypothetical protein